MSFSYKDEDITGFSNLPGSNTGFEFGRQYERSDFSRFMNVVSNLRHAAGGLGTHCKHSQWVPRAKPL